MKRDTIHAFKLANGCMDCGFDAAPEALQFDHRPGAEKKFQIGGSWDRSWEALTAEIAKCDVVCANCHAQRTRTRG